MADKKLNEVTKVTDLAYVPVIMADGSIGQIAKSDLASVVAGNMSVTHVSKTINGITIDTYNYGNIVTVILSGTATTNFSYADIYDVGLVKTAKRIRHNILGTSGYITTRTDGDYFNINGIKEGESIGNNIDGYISFTYVRS